MLTSIPEASLDFSQIALAELVEDDGEQDDRAEHDFLQIRINMDEVHRIVEQPDEQRAEKGSPNRTLATHERRSADDDGCDRLEQLVVRAGIRGTR